jgi:hypothetical protein
MSKRSNRINRPSHIRPSSLSSGTLDFDDGLRIFGDKTTFIFTMSKTTLSLHQGFSTGVSRNPGFREMLVGVPREIVIKKKNIDF